MKKLSEASYNERLFSGGIRKNLHLARFKWIIDRIRKYNCKCEKIVEIGCGDAKILDLIPWKPMRYVGIDANWEGALDNAKSKWLDNKSFEFKECVNPKKMGLRDEIFDIAICMETLEHVSHSLAINYIKELVKSTNGYLFITVPNEIGIIFFLKFLIKKGFGDSESYSFQEVISQTIGKTNKVIRLEHKGFNYRTFIKEVSCLIEIIEVSGIPINFFPPYLNFGVGIIGKRKLSNT
jgi:2-polyprenyl-3-methyl-5-hydroxy-6-metoxy-1,4-benzoquinol methylase